MTVSQIVKLCGEICQLNLSEQYFQQGDTTAVQDPTVQKLLQCANAVLDELYSEYLFVQEKATVVAQNGFANTSHLPIAKVLKVTDCFGKSLPFSLAEGGISVADGTVTVTYARLPQTIAWQSTVVRPQGFSTRVLVYGIVAEFFLRCGDRDNASLWQARYMQSLKSCLKKAVGNMPARRWQ